MLDVASITVAVISLTASIGVAIASGVVTIYSDDRKARQETERLLRKYRDPLLLAAVDLQSRIYNIVDQGILAFLHRSPDHQDCLVVYTAFLFGQYLCWTQILRQQAQFASFATEERGRTKRLVDLLGRIQQCLNTDRWGEGENPFAMWKGHQLAIGELMIVSTSDSELLCMGFAGFTARWKAEADKKAEHNAAGESKDGATQRVFRPWFANIERGIYEVDRQKRRGDSTGLNRLRRLQHLLLELIDVLDPEGARVGARDSKPVGAAPACACSKCDALPKKSREGV